MNLKNNLYSDLFHPRFLRQARWSLVVLVLLLGSCNFNGPSYSDVACTQTPSGNILCSTGTLNKPGTCGIISSNSVALAHLIPEVQAPVHELHLPQAVRDFRDRGPLRDDEELSIIVFLKLDNEAGLDQRLAQIYQPGSSLLFRPS